MNGRAIPGAYLFRLYVCDKEMSWPHHIGDTNQPDWVVYVRDSEKFRLTNVIPERIIFVSRGVTVMCKKCEKSRRIYLFNQSVSAACVFFFPSALYLFSSFSSWLNILKLLPFVSDGTCTVWPVLVLSVHPKLFLYLLPLLLLLLACWTAAPTPDGHSELHKPSQHCHMSCSPENALQKVANCASHRVHLH